MSLYQQYSDNCIQNDGSSAHISQDEYNHVMQMLEPHLKEICDDELALTRLLKQEEDMEQIKSVAKEMRARFKTLIVLGTGGSILNPKTLCALKRSENDKHIFFADTVDPHIFENELDKVDLNETAFLAISKSGSTLETISQTLIALEYSKQILGDNFAKHWFFITDPTDNCFRKLAHEINAKIIDHPLEIGGRYSGLSSVGLLPSAFMGLDIERVRKGAAKIVENLCTKKEKSFVAEGAALYFLFMQKHITISVMLPYIERLSAFTDWYCQIVAESLGKNGKGITPVRSIGPLDQHSQLQLFLDGPKNKFFHIITQQNHCGKYAINNVFKATKQFDYLHQKNLADILCAEQEATIETLKQKHCPVRHIELTSLDEEALGALMMHMMLEVILVGRLMKIDPFDQPAVEAGKILTKKLLNESK